MLEAVAAALSRRGEMMWMRVSTELEDWKAHPNNYHQSLMILGFDASWLVEENCHNCCTVSGADGKVDIIANRAIFPLCKR